MKTDVKQDKLFEAIVNLTRQEVEHNVQMGPNLHAPIDASEIILVEQIVLGDSQVQAAIAECQLPKGTVVVCDPWIYGMSTQISISHQSAQMLYQDLMATTMTSACASASCTCAIQQTPVIRMETTMRSHFRYRLSWILSLAKSSASMDCQLVPEQRSKSEARLNFPRAMSILPTIRNCEPMSSL